MVDDLSPFLVRGGRAGRETDERVRRLLLRRAHARTVAATDTALAGLAVVVIEGLWPGLQLVLLLGATYLFLVARSQLKHSRLCAEAAAGLLQP